VITGKNVTKTYSGTPILTQVEFKLGNNKKVGLVGKNGCGKTTLLKTILEIEEIDSGNILVESEKIGYIPQELNFSEELVGELLEKRLKNKWEVYKIDALVTKLKYENYDPYQKIETLSEGQKMKLKLIDTLLTEPTTLLIDEPTNHLDIEGIIWFEDYIKNLDKTVLMISHDRSFLNHTVDEIWEIENEKLLRFVGDYDNYKSEKLKLIHKWDSEYTQFLKRKKKLEDLLKNVRKIKDAKARGKAVEAAKKRIEREVENNSKEKYESKKMTAVNFETEIHVGKLMIRFEEVAKNFGENAVFEDLSFEIRGKEKVWLFGPNGAGKTTLVKIIMGEETQSAGVITLGKDISIGYFAQKQTHLPFDNTVQEYFIKQTKCEYGKSFGILNKFLFDKKSLEKKIRFLSPGERARFAFAIFAYNDYDLLILDEPTNHLDIETKEVIEESLRDYKGTLLLISHDRYFVESTDITKILNLKNGRLELY